MNTDVQVQASQIMERHLAIVDDVSSYDRDFLQDRLSVVFNNGVVDLVEDRHIENEVSLEMFFLDYFPDYLLVEQLEWLEKNHLVISAQDSLEEYINESKEFNPNFLMTKLIKFESALGLADEDNYEEYLDDEDYEDEDYYEEDEEDV